MKLLNLLYVEEISILENMMLRTRAFILILIMSALPLQGALAAIMPLCAQARNMSAGLDAHIIPLSSVVPSAIPPVACGQHDSNSHEQFHSGLGADGATDEAGFALSCDGVVCHISGNGPPSVTTSLNFAGGFSYPVSFNIHFYSFVLQQPQRPPLA
ncbi:hypothetical protein [Nitrosospira sp. Nsp1]|uniref:hypothetical protein n=1 Tax=Nitrosospira sp. Nsp1 TaxID=136547 RepID=UPI0008923CCC|nr:hypothetical protein [Nitrosospira sp. Nsp1]SCX46036.1 hypothetical protein SAMN05720354_10660 [Nitrosospira sp. Nsp1]